MSFTADIYKEICTDIAKNSRPNSVYAMRMLKLSNGINIAFSINTLTYMRGAFSQLTLKQRQINSLAGKALTSSSLNFLPMVLIRSM